MGLYYANYSFSSNVFWEDTLIFLKNSNVSKTMDTLLFCPYEYGIFKLFQVFSVTNNGATNVLVSICLHTVSAYL